MLEKGEISFIFLWILNPLVILFYQNCSMLPIQATDKPSSAYVESSRTPSCAHSAPGDCMIPY